MKPGANGSPQTADLAKTLSSLILLLSNRRRLSLAKQVQFEFLPAKAVTASLTFSSAHKSLSLWHFGQPYISAAIFNHCLASLALLFLMETNDNPTAQRSPLLDAHPLQPSSLHFLADWEIKELILRLEAEQRRREQGRWEEAEHVRRGEPQALFPSMCLLPEILYT